VQKPSIQELTPRDPSRDRGQIVKNAAIQDLTPAERKGFDKHAGKALNARHILPGRRVLIFASSHKRGQALTPCPDGCLKEGLQCAER
jgi:hypothetical protein